MRKNSRQIANENARKDIGKILDVSHGPVRPSEIMRVLNSQHRSRNFDARRVSSLLREREDLTYQKGVFVRIL
jgi:hypothetical protein